MHSIAVCQYSSSGIDTEGGEGGREKGRGEGRGGGNPLPPAEVCTVAKKISKLISFNAVDDKPGKKGLTHSTCLSLKQFPTSDLQ
jgi:hypothetical protein